MTKEEKKVHKILLNFVNLKKWKLLTSLNNHKLRNFPIPVISFSLNGLIAGTTNYNKNLIRINNQLLLKENKKFLKEVIAHEYCHFMILHIDYILDKKTPLHGKDWCSLMESFGFKDPQTYHKFKLKSVLEMYEYSCNCVDKIHYITSIRHNKIINHNQSYKCSICDKAIISHQG